MHRGPFAWLLKAVTAHDVSPHEPAYFWLTGLLSAFLDNAPTYLVFFQLAGGDAAELMGKLSSALAAISMGAVCMGALTYIGNAPNFNGRGHRQRARRQDAELLRLHAVVVRRAAAGAGAAHRRFRRLALTFALPRLAAAGFEAGFAVFAGSTAIASISNSAPGRASCEIATVVEAGGAAMLK